MDFNIVKRFANNLIHIIVLLSVITFGVYVSKSLATPMNTLEVQELISPKQEPAEFKIPQRKLPIIIHRGGSLIPVETMEKTIDMVFERIYNLQNRSKYFKMLVLETAMIETHLGKAKYQNAEIKYRNYGLMQFREQSAKDVLNRLKKSDEISYNSLMSFYDYNHNLIFNLSYNVPFTVGLCAEYYLARSSCNDIDTLEKRAKLWKKHYNTHKGLGTVQAYIKKVNAIR